MPTTYVPTNNMENGFTIMTHVIPRQSSQPGPGQNGAETGVGIFNRQLERNVGYNLFTQRPVRTFTKVAKVLGTVQIMTAGVSFLLSVVLTQNAGTQFFMKSLLGYWGSALYIITGVLSMAAKNNFHSRLVKGSVAMNTVSAVTAGIAVILLSLDLAYSLIKDCYLNAYCNMLKSQTSGISGVLLVFSLLQFIVSICMTLFGLDIMISTEPAVSTNSRFPSLEAGCPPYSPYSPCSPCSPCSPYNHEEGVFVISNPSMENSQTSQPPEYSETEPPVQT